MRVMMSLFRSQDPCVDIVYGEIEDYTISFIETSKISDDLTKNIDINDVVWSLIAYPNPAREIIYFKGIDNQTDDREQFLIINSLGQQMASGSSFELLSGLSVSNWNSGAYFIHLRNKSGDSRSLVFLVER